LQVATAFFTGKAAYFTRRSIRAAVTIQAAQAIQVLPENGEPTHPAIQPPDHDYVKPDAPGILDPAPVTEQGVHGNRSDYHASQQNPGPLIRKPGEGDQSG